VVEMADREYKTIKAIAKSVENLANSLPMVKVPIGEIIDLIMDTNDLHKVNGKHLVKNFPNRFLDEKNADYFLFKTTSWKNDEGGYGLFYDPVYKHYFYFYGKYNYTKRKFTIKVKKLAKEDIEAWLSS
jgi:hypothetical protein